MASREHAQDMALEWSARAEWLAAWALERRSRLLAEAVAEVDRIEEDLHRGLYEAVGVGESEVGLAEEGC